MNKATITLDTIAQALAWLECEGDFKAYMETYEYGNDELLGAVQAYSACCEAYRELAAEKYSIQALAKHFDSL